MQKIAYHIKTNEELRKPNALKRFARQWDLQLMVLPALFFILVFSYIPMYGVLMAFQDYNLFKGFGGSPWVGIKHFEMFLPHLSSGRSCAIRL